MVLTQALSVMRGNNVLVAVSCVNNQNLARHKEELP